MFDRYSVAHVRVPDEARLPSPFTYGENVFRECFKFSRDDGYQLMNSLAQAGNFNAERHKKYHKYSFDIILFSTISYLTYGEMNYLTKHHEAYKKLLKKELLEHVPRVCLTIILLWSESHVCFPLVKGAIKRRLKSFKDKNCPNIIGILNAYNFEVKKFNKALFGGRKNVSMIVQFVCDDLGRFIDVFSSFNPLVQTKTHAWQISNVRKAMKSIRENFSDLFLVTKPDYPADDDLILTPGSPRVQSKEISYDVDITHVIDRSVTDLRNRFECLNTGIPYYHQDTFYVINACVILHNIILTQNMFVPYLTRKRK